MYKETRVITPQANFTSNVSGVPVVEVQESYLVSEDNTNYYR